MANTLKRSEFEQDRNLLYLTTETKKILGISGKNYFATRHINVDSYGFYNTANNLKAINETVNNFYVLNSAGFRSPEFIKGGQKTLFAGCSHTFGEGMWEEYLWSSDIFKRLNDNGFEPGVYQNIGIPGAGIGEIAETVSKYIEEFGLPKYIFMLLPPLDRDRKDQSEIVRELVNKYESILTVATWDVDFTIENVSEDDYRNSISQMIQFKKRDMENALFDNSQKIKKEIPKGRHKFLLVGLDGAHPGIAEQTFYSDLMYNGFYDKINKVGNLEMETS